MLSGGELSKVFQPQKTLPPCPNSFNFAKYKYKYKYKFKYKYNKNIETACANANTNTNTHTNTNTIKNISSALLRKILRKNAQCKNYCKNLRKNLRKNKRKTSQSPYSSTEQNIHTFTGVYKCPKNKNKTHNVFFQNKDPHNPGTKKTI